MVKENLRITLGYLLSGISWTAHSNNMFSEEPLPLASATTFYKYINQIDEAITELTAENQEEMVQDLKALKWFALGKIGEMQIKGLTRLKYGIASVSSFKQSDKRLF